MRRYVHRLDRRNEHGGMVAIPGNRPRYMVGSNQLHRTTDVQWISEHCRWQLAVYLEERRDSRWNRQERCCDVAYRCGLVERLRQWGGVHQCQFIAVERKAR